MRIAIAGATGFLGSAIARAVSARGDTVIALPRRSIDSAPGVVAEPDTSNDRCRQRAADPDALIWAAGDRNVHTAAGRAAHVDDLIATADRLRPRRVIYLSTGEVYGDGDGDVPFHETAPLRGASAYAHAKLDGEAALRGISVLATKSTSTCAIALRLPVVYGPNQRPSMLIPQLLRALHAGEPIALSAGHQTRDFLHVDDAVRAVLAAIATPTSTPAPTSTPMPADRSSLPPAINIATGVETRIRDLCCELARLVARARRRPEAELLALLRFGERPQRTGEPLRSALAIDLAARALDWRPQIALRDGLASLVPTQDLVQPTVWPPNSSR